LIAPEQKMRASESIALIHIIDERSHALPLGSSQWPLAGRKSRPVPDRPAMHMAGLRKLRPYGGGLRVETRSQPACA
jgi:hypothetical protein